MEMTGSLNGFLKVAFQGSRVTSDAGLILVRELDERLGLAGIIAAHLRDSRHGLNTQFRLPDLLRQSVYSRLAGYEDLNDAQRLSGDPTFDLIGSPTRWDRSAVFSFEPRCHGLCGSQKYTRTSVATVKVLCATSSVPRSQVSDATGICGGDSCCRHGSTSRLAHMATAAGARTSLFVPEQSRLYLAVPHRGGQKAEVRVYEAR
jgi:Transposase DDE domain group 1